MQVARYVRLFVDKQGESHFEDLQIDLAPVDFAPPAPPLNYAAFLRAMHSSFLGAPVGWGGEVPHPSPRRQIFCTPVGEYDVTASDGTKRHFAPGSVLLLEDTTGKGHSTHITGGDDALILIVVLAD